jgi:pimeloyl-ACP methyl ester carboxylesterase
MKTSMPMSLVIVAWSVLLPNTSYGFRAESFSVPTMDGKTVITGEIDFPSASARDSLGRYSTVIMVPGTGMFDRDVDFGISGTRRDLLFRDMAEQLTNAGLAVVRMDYRGVLCSKWTMPPCPECDTLAKRLEHLKISCFRNEIRKDVTTQTIQDDIVAVYDWTQHHPSVDVSRIAVFAHSEGTVHVARLIGQHRIQPRGLLLMGMVAESPASMIQWQIVDRNMKIFEWDLNGDDILSNDEIRTGWTTDKFFHGMGVTLDQILSPEGFWEKNAFLKMLRDDFKAYVDETMSVSDDASYPIQQKPDELIMASQQWWKWWFSDQSSTLDDLVGFNGKIITHNGDFDSQTPGVRELGFVQARLAEFAVPPTTILHPGMGHGMNSNSPTYGPMDESVRRMIVNDINSLVGPFSTECH